MNTLEIRNWRKFQHYSHRNPPWIKLHVELMQSEDWVTWNDASKLLAVACMMIAARNDGKIPNNPEYIKRVAFLDLTPDLGPLISCGFLSEVLADASALQADASKMLVRVEKRQSRDRVEKKDSPPPVKASRKKPKTPLPDGWAVPENGIEYAKAKGFNVEEIARMEEKFKNNHLSKGNLFSDWTAAWRTWVNNQVEWSPPAATKPWQPF